MQKIITCSLQYNIIFTCLNDNNVQSLHITGDIQGLFILWWFSHFWDYCAIFVNLTQVQLGVFLLCSLHSFLGAGGTGLMVFWSSSLGSESLCCWIEWLSVVWSGGVEPPRQDMSGASWLPVGLSGGLLLSSTASAWEGGMSTMVESLAVVGEVKGVVYSSSSLLSSSPDMCSDGEGLVILECVSPWWEVPLGLPHGVLATLGISSPPSPSSEPELSSSPTPPSCLSPSLQGQQQIPMKDPGSTTCNALDSIHKNTRGRLVHHLCILYPPTYLVSCVCPSRQIVSPKPGPLPPAQHPCTSVHTTSCV